MSSPLIEHVPLGFPWQTLDPFLFCVHHRDAYPRGNSAMGPDAPLSGRSIGNDFSYKDGWSMYHGEIVPGFPRHPHRGFETITIARSGLIDHSDSLGAAARFGAGDVQWMTAGRGIVHSEMFPLVREDEDNPLELFQIWMNLPAQSKMAEPYFSMYWNETIPRLTNTDSGGRRTEVTLFAGGFSGVQGVTPPPDSWASRKESAVKILTIVMQDGAEFTLPASEPGVNRVLYFFLGQGLSVAGVKLPPGTAALLQSSANVQLAAAGPCEMLVLEGRPIGEPVAQYGPFVMNTEQEIHQAFEDYRRTQFGGWPWGNDAPVHERPSGRFARHADGRMEHPAK